MVSCHYHQFQPGKSLRALLCFVRLTATCVDVVMETYAALDNSVQRVKSETCVKSVQMSQCSKSVALTDSPIHLPVLLDTVLDWHLLILFKAAAQVW